MTLTGKVRSGWERRFPEIVRPWTHWRILGDRETLADVPGDDLLSALQVVEKHVDRFRFIRASRVAYDATGACVLCDKALFEIASTAHPHDG